MKKLFKVLAPAALSLLSLTRLHAEGVAAENIPAAKGSIVFSGIAFELRSQAGPEGLSRALRELGTQYGFVADMSFPPSLVETERNFNIQVDTAAATETYLTIGYAPHGSVEALSADKAIRRVKGGKTPLSCDKLPSLLTVISQHQKLFAVNGVSLLGVARSCPPGSTDCRANVVVRSNGQADKALVRAEMLKQVPELSTWDLQIETLAPASPRTTHL
jgi:hypothetical protein